MIIKFLLLIQSYFVFIYALFFPVSEKYNICNAYVIDKNQKKINISNKISAIAIFSGMSNIYMYYWWNIYKKIWGYDHLFIEDCEFIDNYDI